MLFCGSWKCSHCRAVLAKGWARIARFGVKYGQAARQSPLFWTFTLPSRFHSAQDGYNELRRLWDSLRKAIQRDQGRFDYLAFVEGQSKRRNMPHFHVLVFARVPAAFHKRRNKHNNIKDFAAHYGFGGQAKEVDITSDAAATYVSKYVSKSTPEIPKHFRRVRASRSWPRPPEQAKKAYLVRGIGEQIADFILRVEAVSGRDADELIREYQAAQLSMEIMRMS